MPDIEATGADQERISKADYERLCALIQAEAGIHLGSEKRTMLEIRIRRRLRALRMDSYGQYCRYLFGSVGRRAEIGHLIDVVTTNKTDFFREPRHFDFLAHRVLPEWAAQEAGRSFLIWSAGCSTGEEPYTLAMVLSEFAQAHPGFRFHVLATDVSTIVLEKAALGVYPEEATEPIPEGLKRRYFLRSRDPSAHRVRVVPELRRMVELRRLNFMDEDYRVGRHVDAVFCRNVIIYFDRATQERILGKLAESLLPGGYFFVGHAETLHNMNLPLTPVAPSLYRKSDP